MIIRYARCKQSIQIRLVIRLTAQPYYYFASFCNLLAHFELENKVTIIDLERVRDAVQVGFAH